MVTADQLEQSTDLIPYSDRRIMQTVFSLKHRDKLPNIKVENFPNMVMMQIALEMGILLTGEPDPHAVCSTYSGLVTNETHFALKNTWRNSAGADGYKMVRDQIVTVITHQAASIIQHNLFNSISSTATQNVDGLLQHAFWKDLPPQIPTGLRRISFLAKNCKKARTLARKMALAIHAGGQARGRRVNVQCDKRGFPAIWEICKQHKIEPQKIKFV